MLDTLFWNTTLRSDPTAISSAVAAKQTEETDLVFSQVCQYSGVLCSRFYINT